MTAHGWEHEVKGITRSNLSIEEYKLQERMKEVAAIEERIAEKQAVLDDIERRETGIKNLQKIPVENTMLGDKVKVARKDYYSLLNTAKKYYAYKDQPDTLKSVITVLERTNEKQQTTISKQKEEISFLKSYYEKFFKLKKEFDRLKSKFDKVMEFIDFMGLKDRLNDFLEKFHKKDRSIER